MRCLHAFNLSLSSSILPNNMSCDEQTSSRQQQECEQTLDAFFFFFFCGKADVRHIHLFNSIFFSPPCGVSMPASQRRFCTMSNFTFFLRFETFIHTSLFFLTPNYLLCFGFFSAYSFFLLLPHNMGCSHPLSTNFILFFFAVSTFFDFFFSQFFAIKLAMLREKYFMCVCVFFYGKFYKVIPSTSPSYQREGFGGKDGDGSAVFRIFLQMAQQTKALSFVHTSFTHLFSFPS